MTKALFSLAVILSLGIACSVGLAQRPSSAAPPIIPAPLSVTYGAGAFDVTKGTRVTFAGPAAERAARYFTGLLERTRGLSLAAGPEAGGAATIHFALTVGARADDEGYSLTVSPERIVISSVDPRGLFYGAASLWQLSTANAADETHIAVPAMTITDTPRFRWRGLMLDSARHFQSPEFVKRLIDIMALHKLNVLHWHLTDDQAWRLSIERYPKLTDVGAWRVPAGPAAAADIDPQTRRPRLYGGFYSKEQVRDIVAYATARHITIVPEIEMPGHASAAIAAYPELGVAPTGAEGERQRTVPADWGIYRNLFNVEESTFAFLENVLDEVLELFPGEYIHVGGDEAVKDQWRASQRVQDRMRELGVADEHELQSYFVRRIERYLDSRGRRLIGWDEILEGGLAPNATVMSWRGIDGAVAAAAAGHDAVLSPAPVLYFDNRPVASAMPGRGLVVGVEDVYRFDPAPGVLSEAQREHILGVQANIWTEHIRTQERVEYMTFPRAAALAEVAWSAAERIDWPSFSARLPAQLARYDMLGIGYAGRSVSAADARPPREEQRSSHELRLCSEALVLSLEDDAPPRGMRAVFRVDIMNPCWIYEDADLSQVSAIAASVGQVPFNFQIGDDVNRIPLRNPATREGELEVRIDGCDGATIATLPLAPALGNFAVTTLPPAAIEAREGRHELCLTFTRDSVDPIWTIDSVELVGGRGR